jgi:hypothetical protein
MKAYVQNSLKQESFVILNTGFAQHKQIAGSVLKHCADLTEDS